jgi:hypothetical protein
MTPEHHEERLCAWAEKTGRPVLSLDYGKAPECECNLFYISATAHVLDLRSEFCRGCGSAGGSCATRVGRMFLIEWWTLINFVAS